MGENRVALWRVRGVVKFFFKFMHKYVKSAVVRVFKIQRSVGGFFGTNSRRAAVSLNLCLIFTFNSISYCSVGAATYLEL